MNYRMIFSTTGKVIIAIGLLLVLPLVVAFIYGEWRCAMSFGISIGGSLLVGGLLVKLLQPKSMIFFSKEGFVTVAICWIAASLVGAAPFMISGEIPGFADAFFEIVSGLTTTGASVVANVEGLSRSILFWRSFSHWVGGMGVLVFVMAVTSRAPDRSMHILRAEMPGPIVDKLVPRSKDTAKILYLIYIVMTAVVVIALRICGMPLFDSLLHAFGTAGTGGFGIKADSVAGYSHSAQWVITIGMFLFGVNFNLYYLILIKRFKAAIKSQELWAYFGIVLTSTVIITLNILSLCSNFAEALRLSAFQVCSIISTTGFSTTNFDLWPSLSKAILLFLMFSGACAGSTAGGIKVSRLVILCRTVKRDFKKALHPRTASVVKFEGKKLDEGTISGVTNYFTIYSFLFIIILLLISIDPWCGVIQKEGVFNVFETNFSAALTCFNNVGPGLAAVGPLCSFGSYSFFSKIVLSFAMLLGRLEIYPILLALIPSTWIKK